MNEFCTHNAHEECVQKIGLYVRDETLVNNAAITKDQLNERVKTYLQERMSAPVESVFIEENL